MFSTSFRNQALASQTSAVLRSLLARGGRSAAGYFEHCAAAAGGPPDALGRPAFVAGSATYFGQPQALGLGPAELNAAFDSMDPGGAGVAARPAFVRHFGPQAGRQPGRPAGGKAEGADASLELLARFRELGLPLLAAFDGLAWGRPDAITRADWRAGLAGLNVRAGGSDAVEAAFVAIGDAI